MLRLLSLVKELKPSLVLSDALSDCETFPGLYPLILAARPSSSKVSFPLLLFSSRCLSSDERLLESMGLHMQVAVLESWQDFVHLYWGKITHYYAE